MVDQVNLESLKRMNGENKLCNVCIDSCLLYFIFAYSNFFNYVYAWPKHIGKSQLYILQHLYNYVYHHFHHKPCQE